MQLEFLCEMELFYQTLPSFETNFILVQPYGGEEGSGYGEREGTITGSKINGSLRWVNHPHRRSDGVMLPDAHGVIKTADGASVLFSLTGRTVFRADGEGRQMLTALFEAQAEEFRWLNTTFCVVEGKIDPAIMKMKMRVFSCVSDLD